MKVDPEIPTFGDMSFRGDCPKEDIDQINFVSWLKHNYPTHRALFIHPKNEGKRKHNQVNYESRTGGIPTGASDCIIPGCPAFVVELKRQDHTKSQWQKGQQQYLINAKEAGAFIGVAFGFEGLKEAFLQWLELQQ